MKQIILLSISTIIFTAYNIYMRVKYGKLPTVSDGYYKLKFKPLFTLTLWGFAVPIMLATANDSIFMFLSCVFICFVAVAPAFKNWEVENKIHYIGATGSVVLAMLAMLFSYHSWYIVLLFGVLSLTTALSIKSNRIGYWIEILAFYLTLIGLFVYYLRQIFVV